MKKTVIELIHKDTHKILFRATIEPEDYADSTEYLTTIMEKNTVLYPYYAFGQDDRSIRFRLIQFKAGLKYGYPLCCVIDYCFSERPAWKYGTKKTKGDESYVPCRMCSNK